VLYCTFMTFSSSGLREGGGQPKAGIWIGGPSWRRDTRSDADSPCRYLPRNVCILYPAFYGHGTCRAYNQDWDFQEHASRNHEFAAAGAESTSIKAIPQDPLPATAHGSRFQGRAGSSLSGGVCR